MKFNIMKFNYKSLLENKFVLYLMFFIALTTIFGYFMSNNCSAVLFFILLALLTNYFSKNMIVILGCAIVGTHLLAVLNMFGTRREGFNNEQLEDSDNKNLSEANTTSAEPSDKSTAAEDKPADKPATESTTKSTPSHSPSLSDKPSKDSGFTNMGADYKLDPAKITPSKDQLLSKGDKAKAKEKAYDLLESTIGKDNLQGITNDTQALLKKQSELMDELKNITPVLSQAMGMFNNLDLNNLTGMFDKLTDMMPNAAKTQ